MLSEIIDSFKRVFKDNLDEAILGSYVPTDGTYIFLKEDEHNNLKVIQKEEIKLNKKTKDVDRTINNFSLLAKADYYSKLTDMNKPIDSKKIIHSNNYLSFFVKKESLKNGKLTNEIIENYYNVLLNPISKYEKKSKAKELYIEIERELGEVNKDRIFKIKEWIKENIYKVEEDIEKKDYLKIFFIYDEDDFIKESKRYLIPNIYNNNDFNIKVDNEILGLPNDNMGLNSKKPYLENKTRKVKIPHLITQEEALFQKKVFDYLLNQSAQGFYNIYIGDDIVPLKDNETLNRDFNGYYIRLKKGKEAEIHNFDVISKYSPMLRHPFGFINVLGINYEKLYLNKKINWEYGFIDTRKEMQELINSIIFNNYLKTNYFSEDISIKENILKRSILLSRAKLFDWFYKGNDYNIWPLLNKVSRDLMKSSIESGYSIKAMNQFNLRYSLKLYFEGGEEKMADILSKVKNDLREKIEVRDSSISNDNEYFFAIGQLANFFITRSKGKNKPLSLANPIINAKKDNIIKEKLKSLYKKYNYDINSSFIKFKNMYYMVLAYQVEGKINEDLIIAGYLSSSLLFEKKED